MSDQSQQVDVEQLAEAIKGMSDEELKESITTMGVDTTLDQIFDGMQEAFVPEKAGSTNSTIQYDIDADGIKSYSVKIADGKCETSKGEATEPRLTLKLGLVDFVRLIFGQADGTQLFMTGKMKLAGDMMFAMQMQGMFKQPGT